MIRETVYDEIFDAQRHFRTVLDSMSRPGKINRFAPLALTTPEGLTRAAAYVGFALLNADVAAHAVGKARRPSRICGRTPSAASNPDPKPTSFSCLERVK